jgi:CheY-specific phosphatase CheX
MNMNYFNAFVGSMESVIGNINQGEPVIKGDFYVVEGEFLSSGITAFTDISGAFSGSCIIDMDFETSLRLTALFMRLEVDKSDGELVRSCVGEIANQVGGAAVSQILDMGDEINLSTPKIITGNSSRISDFAGGETIVLPLQSGNMKIQTGLLIRG